MNFSSHYRKSLERERNLLMTKADNYGKNFIKNGPSGLNGISAAAEMAAHLIDGIKKLQFQKASMLFIGTHTYILSNLTQYLLMSL